MRNLSVVTILLFFIYPFVSLSLIIVEIYNQRRYAYNLLALLMGLLAYLWVPSGDLYRISQDFDFLKESEFMSIFRQISLDYMYNILLYFFAKIGLDFAHVRLVLATVSYSLYFRIVRETIKDNRHINNSKTLSFLTFLVMFFVIRVTGLVTGVRFTVGFAFFLTAVHASLRGNSAKSNIFYLLAGLMHFSFWIGLFSLIVGKKALQSQIKWLITLISMFLLSSILVEKLVLFLPLDESLKRHLEFYTTGFFALEEYKQKSVAFKISRILSYLTIYPAFIFLFFRRTDFRKYWPYVGITAVLAFSTSMNSVFSRYALMASVVFIVSFLRAYTGRDKVLLLGFLLCTSLTFLGSVWTTRRELSKGKQKQLLYAPFPLILQSEYSNSWLDENIKPNGDFRN